MAFRPARPLSHHTNLQLTDAAADAIERIFGFESSFGMREKQHLCWKIAIKH